MRVTDLEKFALEQVWRPYQNLIGYEQRLEKLPVSIDETARLLSLNTRWSALVLGRLAAIGISIPYYIKHPLADVIRSLPTKAHGTSK